MGFATKVPRTFRAGCIRVPAKNRELLFSALDDKPVNRIAADDPAHLTPVFPQSCHGFSLASISVYLRASTTA
jgi:hypothetical protein